MKILIVENNEDLAMTLVDAVYMLGHNGEVVISYDVAITSIIEDEIDLLLLNCKLSGEVEPLIEMAKINHVKIVVYSTGKQNSVKCEEYLMAPFSLSELERALLSPNGYKNYDLNQFSPDRV